MTTVFALIFWISATLVVYHLFGYPLFLAAAARLWPRPVKRGPFTPFISVIVAAHNEQAVIRTKLASVLDSSYPPERIEVILANDGSTDDTLQEALRIDDPRLVVEHNPVRQGKMSVLNRAIRRARGEIIVISDAKAMVQPEALANLMSNFADPQIGSATGRIVLHGADTQTEANENFYWRYEAWIKKQESQIGSTPAAVGSLLALRRPIYQPPGEKVINDDFQIVLMTVRAGYRAIYDPSALAMEARTTSMAGEYERKSRIAAGRWQAVGDVLKLTLQRPGFVFMFVSHKLLRLLMLPIMLLAYLGNLAAVIVHFARPNPAAGPLALGAPWGELALAGQTFFYFLAVLGSVLEQNNIHIKPISIIYYFVNAQFASFTGLARFSSGQQSVLWRKASGS